MEVEFENLLCKARRGEEVFNSFSEAREKFFSSVGDATLYNALEYLGVETLACNEEERIFFPKTTSTPNWSCQVNRRAKSLAPSQTLAISHAIPEKLSTAWVSLSIQSIELWIHGQLSLYAFARPV